MCRNFSGLPESTQSFSKVTKAARPKATRPSRPALKIFQNNFLSILGICKWIAPIFEGWSSHYHWSYVNCQLCRSSTLIKTKTNHVAVIVTLSTTFHFLRAFSILVVIITSIINWFYNNEENQGSGFFKLICWECYQRCSWPYWIECWVRQLNPRFWLVLIDTSYT